MRGGYFRFDREVGNKTDAVERARQLDKEAAELRLAKAHNTPKEKVNTPWESAQKIAKLSQDTSLAGSPRKANV